MFITVTALVPHVHKLKVLPVIVLTAPPPLAPSMSNQPLTIVAPVTVMFEKLFPVSVFVDPIADEGPPVVK